MPRVRVIVAAPVVVRQDVDELVDAIAEQFHDRRTHRCVSDAPMRDELCLIDDLLNERVPERVLLLRRRFVWSDEPIALESGERGSQRLAGRNLREDACPERPPDDGRALSDMLGAGVERVELCFEEVLNGRGYSTGAARAE